MSKILTPGKTNIFKLFCDSCECVWEEEHIGNLPESVVCPCCRHWQASKKCIKSKSAKESGTKKTKNFKVEKNGNIMLKEATKEIVEAFGPYILEVKPSKKRNRR